MKKISKILCVIDPESKAQPSLERGAWLAGHLGAELHLLLCYYNEYLSDGRLGGYPSLENAQEEMLAGMTRQLESLAEPHRAAGLTVKTAAAWDHPLYEGIVRHAEAIDADIVFKDTHHHSAVSRALLTNTDWNLIRTCPGTAVAGQAE